jgi:HSP90 family molecular chaperone
MIKAKGTKTLSDDEQSNLIGQFGVGFYSGFLVADKMTVYSKGWNDPDGKTHVWQSEAGSSYSIAEVEGDEAIQAGSGTRCRSRAARRPLARCLCWCARFSRA